MSYRASIVLDSSNTLPGGTIPLCSSVYVINIVDTTICCSPFLPAETNRKKSSLVKIMEVPLIMLNILYKTLLPNFDLN